MLKPLFIFSLPRSGSTLLQRVLSADHQISSVAEPWLLLPLIYAFKEKGIKAEYSHQWASIALNDFINELPGGKQDYLTEMGTAIRNLYQKASSSNNNARYFLDKTPRYTLIADEIIDTFPEGKFIYLWRNPLAIIASIIDTWSSGKWDLSMCEIDLYDGMANIISNYQSVAENGLAVQYESFLLSPEKELSRIAEYLDLELDPAVLSNFSDVSFQGELGDPTGSKNYSTVNTAPLEKWKTVIKNPLRKRWCRNYLTWLGETRLKLMGYDLEHLLHELESCEMTTENWFSDTTGTIKRRLKQRHSLSNKKLS